MVVRPVEEHRARTRADIVQTQIPQERLLETAAPPFLPVFGKCF